MSTTVRVDGCGGVGGFGGGGSGGGGCDDGGGDNECWGFGQNKSHNNHYHYKHQKYDHQAYKKINASLSPLKQPSPSPLSHHPFQYYTIISTYSITWPISLPPFTTQTPITYETPQPPQKHF